VAVLLREEGDADAFWLLQVADLEGYVLSDAEDVAVDCGEVPAGGDHELHAHVGVVRGGEQVWEVVVELCHLLNRVLTV